LPFIPQEGQLLDVGSGGGFPAIPIALARPSLTVTMVEANGRKAAFLLRVSRETNAMNTQVLNARAEALTKEYHQQYDIITARAVDNLPKLIKWTKKLLAENGKWLLWKGRSWRDEGNLDRLKLKLLEEVTLSDGGRLLLLERAEPKLP
jgi:16S rRNA (guanine527-N7)-methyltransferase